MMSNLATTTASCSTPPRLTTQHVKILILPHAARNVLMALLEQNRRFLDGVDACLQKGWESYRSTIQSYRTSLDLIDEALDRILYLAPLHEEDGGHSSAWREILYGLLSLNRLAMDCSLQEQQPEPSYGTTIRTDSPPNLSLLPITKIRIAITITHCIMPSLLELVPSLTSSSSSSSSGSFERSKKQASVRLLLERIKCALRLSLLLSYWMQSFQEQQLQQQEKQIDRRCVERRPLGALPPPEIPRTPTTTIVGLLRRGGMYQPYEVSGLALQEEQALERRREYIGKRTGRRVIRRFPGENADDNYHDNKRQAIKFPTARIIVAELLYVLRPLLWASAEARTGCAATTLDHLSTNETATIYALSLLKPWLLTLGMDLTSLELTRHLYKSRVNNSGINCLTRDEWSRRRMNLFLYLLRSPLWSRASSPIMERVCSIVQRFPILGGLMESYLRDYILYWKHPFSSEES